VDLARIYSDMGDVDNAYAWVDKSIAVRSTSLFWIFGTHGPFREDPRFEEMKRKMGARF
jgi:hypothetical protein